MRWLLSVGVLTGLFTAAQSAGAGEDERLANFYLSGMQDSRRELQSGHVVCTGARMTREVSLGKSGLRLGKVSRKTPINLEWFFDGSAVRFDRREGHIDGSVIMTDEAVTSYQASDHAVVKSSQATALSQKIGVFDIRMLGQMSLAELEFGRSMEWLQKLLQNAELVEVADAHDVCQISWVYPQEHPAGEIKRTIRIDSANGFTPVLLEERARPSGSDVDWARLRLMDRADVSWKESNGVWVPVAARMIVAYGEEEVALQFDWRDINGDVPAEEFTVARMRAPEGTYVVDERLGTPIIESILGTPKESRGELPSAWNAASMLLIAFNVVMIIALILWIRHRRAGLHA